MSLYVHEIWQNRNRNFYPYNNVCVEYLCGALSLHCETSLKFKKSICLVTKVPTWYLHLSRHPVIALFIKLRSLSTMLQMSYRDHFQRQADLWYETKLNRLFTCYNTFCVQPLYPIAICFIIPALYSKQA